MKRIGGWASIILVILVILFLFGIISYILKLFQDSYPLPLIYLFLRTNSYYNVASISNLTNLGLYELSLYSLLGFLSMIGILLISFSIYLGVYNKRVLFTKLKVSGFFTLAIVLLLFSSFTCFRLLN